MERRVRPDQEAEPEGLSKRWADVVREGARRTALFFGFYVILPGIVTVMASALLGKPAPGIRDGSPGALARLAWNTAPAFVFQQVVTVVAAGIAIAGVLGLASLLAWPRTARFSWLRVARITVLTWTAAAIMFPAVPAVVPFVGALPWIDVAVAAVALLVILHLFPRAARPRSREMVFAIAVAAVVLTPFGRRLERPEELKALAGRELTSRDVILLGFDSVAASEAAQVIREFRPSAGQKTIFTNAWTPMPLTSAAWRSILSGEEPPAVAALPGFSWPEQRNSWIPRQLSEKGYKPTLWQDLPVGNFYSAVDMVASRDIQGWHAMLQSYLWRAVLPVSNVGARWWVSAFGGPADLIERPAYCAECFMASSLEAMARAAAGGPLFWGTHTCYAHPRIRLKLAEAVKVPGWWRQPSALFDSRGLFADDSRVRDVRIGSVKALLRDTLEHLDKAGVLGHATVLVFSDHGPRGKDVPLQKSGHVFLAAFTPGPQRSVIIRDPVSLRDVAPTVRSATGLQPVAGETPLSFAAGTYDSARSVVCRAVPTVAGTGVGRNPLRADQLAKWVDLRADGAVIYSDQMQQLIVEASQSLQTEKAAPVSEDGDG